MLSQNEENVKQELMKLMKHFQCPICLNLMSDPMVTRCVHHFCGQCITKAIESSTGEYCRCPLCNEKIIKRSLRPQREISDMIEILKSSVDSFENENQMSSITNNNEVIVFDVSSDRSKSCVQTNNSFDNLNETKDSEKSENKSLNKSNVSGIESSEVESNRKTTAIHMSDESTTSETNNESIIDIKDLEETDAYFQSLNDSNDDSNPSIVSIPDQSVDQMIPTQSQNLKVNKSRITYSSSRPPTDDKFDRIIRLSEINSNQNQPKERTKPLNECPKELQNEGKPRRRKPLTQLNKNKKNSLENKRFKRVQTFDSSDDELDPIGSNKQPKKKSSKAYEKKEKEVILSYDDDSEDLFLPAIQTKHNSFELNQKTGGKRVESGDGYESEAQIISSSPFSDF